MHDFHYNFIKRNFDAELLFTDTDSLQMFMKNFVSGKICFTLAIIQKIQSFLMRLIKSSSFKLFIFSLPKGFARTKSTKCTKGPKRTKSTKRHKDT